MGMRLRAFGVARNGKLIVDTIRQDPNMAKQAAIGRLRTNGVRWSELVEDGHDLVTVFIAAGGPCRAGARAVPSAS